MFDFAESSLSACLELYEAAAFSVFRRLPSQTNHCFSKHLETAVEENCRTRIPEPRTEII